MKQQISITKLLMNISDASDFPFGNDALGKVFSGEMSTDEFSAEDLDLLAAAGSHYALTLEKLMSFNDR